MTAQQHEDGVGTQVVDALRTGDTALGIEVDPARIKARLVGPDRSPIATGSHAGENEYVDRTWTYPLESVWEGLRAGVADRGVVAAGCDARPDAGDSHLRPADRPVGHRNAGAARGGATAASPARHRDVPPS